MREPFKHQAEAIDRHAGRNCIPLFWEMRLGKTLVAIRWALRRRSKHTLVVAPLSVLEVWEEELELEDQPYKILQGNPAQRLEAIERDPHCPWWLVNYEGLTVRRAKGETRKSAKPAPILELNWDTIICDESTRLRNAKADVTKAFTKYAYSQNRMLLTGLPNPESTLDFFCQFQACYGGFMGYDNFYKWRQRYFDQIRYDWYPKAGAHATIKRVTHELADWLSRKDVGLYKEKIHEKRYVSLPKNARRLYDQVEARYESDTRSTKWIPVARTWCQRIAGGFFEGEVASHHKLKELKSLLEGELRNDQVVVYFRYNEEIRQALRVLRDAGIKTTWITGETPTSLRTARRRAARRGEHRVVLCQTKCTQYGLDLSFASVAIYYSNWEEYEIRAQSEDRILHPGKEEPLLYIDLLTRDTIDEDIYEALRGKGANAKSFRSRLVDNLRRRRSVKK